MIPMGSGMGGMSSGSLGGGSGMYGAPPGRMGSAAGSDGLGAMQQRQQTHHPMQSPSLLGGAPCARRLCKQVDEHSILLLMSVTIGYVHQGQCKAAEPAVRGCARAEDHRDEKR